MNLSSIRHSFVLKKSKHKENATTIYHRLILIVNGKKLKTLEISSRISVNEKDWDGKKIKGKSNYVYAQNDDLDQQRTNFKSLFNTEVASKSFEPDHFKRLIQSKVLGIQNIVGINDDTKAVTTSYLFKTYLENNSFKLCERRIKLYEFVQLQFSNYLKKTYNVDDIEVSKLRRDDFIKFQKELYVGRVKNTVSSYLRALKAVLKSAVTDQLIPFSPFTDCPTGFEPGKRTPLTIEELQKIVDIPESKLTPRENISRWVFIFACFTALSYADLVKLEKHMIEERHDGLVINVTRTKSKVEAVIPRNHELESVLKLFTQFHSMQTDNRRLLPVPSYNKYNNEDLKAIQRLAGIEKNISTHIARHTFATNWLSRGGSYEALSKILGHTKISTTQIYGKVGTARVIEESNRIYSGETLAIKTVLAP